VMGQEKACQPCRQRVNVVRAQATAKI
jgi:hypothetical protein